MSALPSARTRSGAGPDNRFGRWLGSWRISLAIARRDARRYRGRSALIVVMVALPVLLIVAGLTYAATAFVSPAESVPYRLGNAVAVVEQVHPGRVEQFVDGTDLASIGGEPEPIPGFSLDAPASDRATALGRLVGGTVTPVLHGEVRFADGDRHPRVRALFLDGRAGLGTKAQLMSGRWPASTAEIVVTPTGRHAGLPASGAATIVVGGTRIPVTVVGTAAVHDTDGSMPALATIAPWEGAEVWGTEYLIHRAEPMRWPEVRRLNAHGLAVTSAAVLADPPPAGELPDRPGGPADDDAAMRLVAAVLGTILFALTALLVGPAFAVSAGRQRRALALAASNGAETRQLRRTVLAQAVVLGALAVVIGAGLGIALVAAGTAYVRSRLPWLGLAGPFEVPWLPVAIIVLCAILAALTAALIPATRLGRLDIVGVMRGQNVSPAPDRRLPLAGIVVFGIGAVAVFLAVMNESAATAVVAVIGLVVGPLLCIPMLLVGAGRLAGRLPVAARMATRDAARQRHRAVPTVAAIMAGSALLATFAVALASDTAFSARRYVPHTVAGEGEISLPESGMAAQVRRVVESAAPAWVVSEDRSLGFDFSARPHERASFAVVVPPGCTPVEAGADERCAAPSSNGGPGRSGVLVLPAAELVRRLQLTGAIAEAVHAGAVLVAEPGWIAEGRVRLDYGEEPVISEDGEDAATGAAVDPDGDGVLWSKTATLAAVVIPPEQYARYAVAPTQGLLIPAETAQRLGLASFPVALHVADPAGPISEPAATAVADHLADDLAVDIERGFQRGDDMILAVVFAIAIFLLVTVTLISTALALAEQQSDLGTLAAVGATKGTRRRFAAAQAATVALLGGLLGTVVGLVAGVAVAYPNTSTGWDTVTGEQVSLPPTIAIPGWHLGLLLLGVPLVAALLAALAVRAAPTVTHRT